ncbi:hypothetical protein HELRODRAFT_188972 [Helobdella robusta]|uniref:Uncharacterized protein n=1 Tax=Helobdella robusta TaxID=6412 RepID=T1FQI8_HELRO|nr:hypothetical protein HELRODRAFT_188972 [Helobdella robusta]ESN98989.1 hypothetical protein HELRODRAFT_188972 [Helobdella robusta]
MEVPPQFIITPRDKTVLAGSRVNFRCSVTGNPTPAVFWLKENSQTLMFPKKDYDRLSVTDDGTLMIDNVKKSDAGQYLCKGVNDAGQAYYKAKLEVKDSDDKMHPPIIKLSPQNQTLAANTEATLLCSASGDPTPSIVWLRNNKVLNKKDDKYSIDDSGNLKIKNLRKSDSGKYTCKAFSKIGETSRTCYIQVEAHTNPSVVFYRTPEPSTFPGPPSKPTIADVTDTSVRLMWRNNQNSGSSAVFAYTVEYSSLESGQGWMEASNKVTEQTYIVRNLKPDTYYTFLVRAQNSHGLSLPSPVSDHVRTKGGHNPSQARPNMSALNRSLVAEKISNKSFVFLFPAEATGSTTVVLTWEVRKNHRYVEGFHIRYRCLSDVDDHFYPRGYHSNFNDRGTDLPEEPKNWTIVTVQSSSVTSYTLYNLEKNTWFEMDVQPYYMDIVGMESNKVQVKTLEDVPSASPQHIEARMTKNNTLSISWEPPPKQHHNGFLRGYKIFIFGNNSKFDREIQINSSMRELRIQNMIQDMTYKIQMCAYNRAGDGFRSDPIVIGPLLTSSPDPHLLKQPWFIAMLILLIGGLLWTVLCVFSVWLCRKRSKGIKLHKNCLPNSYMVDNSINAGKVNGYVTTTSTNYPTLSKQNANFINATVNNNSSNSNNNNNNLQSPGSMKNFNKTTNPYNSSDIIPCIIQQQYMIQPKSESTDSGIKQNISTSESNIDSNHLQTDYDDHAAEDGQQYERIDFNLPNEINLFGEHPTLFIPPPPEHPPPTYNSTNASQSPPNAPRWLASQQLPLLPPPHHVAMHSDVEPMNNNYNNNNINNNNIILGSNIVGSLKRGMHTLNYSINKPPSPKNTSNFASTSRPLQNNNNNISNNNIHHVSSERAFEQHQQPFHQRNKSNYSQQLNQNYSLNARLMPAMKNNLRTSHPTSPDSPISEVAILDTDYDVDESDADMNLSQLAQSPSHSDIDNMIGQEPVAVIEGGDQWRNDDMAGEDESSSVSSSDDNNCLTEKDFAKAVARAAKMSGLMVVGSTVIDPNTGKEKVRKSSKHRQRARCSSPYSTDSNYSSIPHKHHPKSERKKRTKMQAGLTSQQPINSSQQHLQQQQQQLRQQMLMRNHSNSQKMIDFNNSSTNFNLLDGNVNKLTHGSSIPLLNNSNESKNTFNNGDFSRSKESDINMWKMKY